MNESTKQPTDKLSCFLTPKERKLILNDGDEVKIFRRALRDRVLERIQHPGFPQPMDGTGWWYLAFEYLSDAAMHYALEEHDETGQWLRGVVLSLARYPADEWVGPWFRDHSEPYVGHLETAHVCWGVASVLDLAPDVFTATELEEIKDALIEKGMIPCQRWLDKNIHLANWRGIMLAGVLVPSAVLGDKQRLETYTPMMQQCVAAFQDDGSYAESLQYGNYLANALMLVYESLVRLHTAYASTLAIEAYAKGMPWVVSSMLYAKPLTGWGAELRARAINFNDSVAIFRPSGDLLLHIAARSMQNDTNVGGLASYLFQTYYTSVPSQGPHHLASFGFINDWGFLTLPLLTQAADPVSPSESNLPLTEWFENGNIFIRDAWDGKTAIAIQGGATPLNGPGHLHGDANSFMLVHNRERLLVDPGHSCYRNLIHGLESSSQTHSTCTFLVEETGLGLQEDLTKTSLLEQQSIVGKRLIEDGIVGEPIIRGNQHIIIKRIGEVSVVGSEAARLYGEPLEEFSRFWISMGSHVLFVVDRIQAKKPVRTCWNWVVNNRDQLAEVTINGQELTVRRPSAGFKFIQDGEAKLFGPVYGYMHDAYHPEPAQLGEGKPGSGLIYRATEQNPKNYRLAVHMFAFDEPDKLDGWQLNNSEAGYQAVGENQNWFVKIITDQPLHVTIASVMSQKQWHLMERNGQFEFNEDI